MDNPAVDEKNQSYQHVDYGPIVGPGSKLQASAVAANSGVDTGLLQCVDESKRNEALELLLSIKRAKQIPDLIAALIEARLPLSEKASAILLDKLDPESLLGQTRLVQLLHVATLSTLEKQLEPLSGKPYTGKAADDLLRFIALRREMHGSLTS